MASATTCRATVARPTVGRLRRRLQTSQAGSGNAAEEARQAENSVARIFYHRKDMKYDGFTLHVWGNSCTETMWSAGLPPAGVEEWGVYFDVSLKKPEDDLSTPGFSFIIHQNDFKETTGLLYRLDLTKPIAATAWVVEGRKQVFWEEPDVSNLPTGDLSLARALWISRPLIAFQMPSDDNCDSVDLSKCQYALHYSSQAEIKLTSDGVTNSDGTVYLEFRPGGVPTEIKERLPYLQHLHCVGVPSGMAATVSNLVKCQLALEVKDSSGRIVEATGLQIQGILDEEFSYKGPLGIEFVDENTVVIRVWAPTAQNVQLFLYESGEVGAKEFDSVQMQPNSSNLAVWEASGPWNGLYYNYHIDRIEHSIATDPYSVSLASNGIRSHVCNINARELIPEGWDDMQKPPLASVMDTVIYELHVRDFSLNDESVPPQQRGTYKAFTTLSSNGMRHLRKLAEAGMTHLHLLPSYDFGSVNEDKSTWKTPGDLSVFASDSPEQQKRIAAISNEDGFNWGYDPVHFMVPDGSYSSDPNGACRIREFREMVLHLNKIGLRTVLDVVYNHLYGSGPHGQASVFDKIVPGYYVRRSLDGTIEDSTVMNNTACENFMFHRFVLDDLRHWAVNYKIDAFRFDIMGHLMLSTVQEGLQMIRAMTASSDGVDGSKAYFYGEGWEFGEVVLNQRGVNAYQFNMFGTGIGTFNDRMRTGVLGGFPFKDFQEQGLITGLFLEPNEDNAEISERVQRAMLNENTEMVIASMAGGLRDYEFESFRGVKVMGKDAGRPGSRCGYVASPAEIVNYVSCHDNTTLFDSIQLKVNYAVPIANRCRINRLGISIVALSQGIPFFHAGDDMLRSKSLDRDSFSSGDWFNKLDFTYASNNFGVGLPLASKNGWKWPRMSKLLANEALKPSSEEILATCEHMREYLRIRKSTDLFRLSSASEIQEQVQFYNVGAGAEPGIIIMSIRGKEIGATQPFSSVVVVINARKLDYKDQVSSRMPEFTGKTLVLHPILSNSHDKLVQQSAWGDDLIRVPGLTASVFVELPN